ncbi:hypothetical protein LEMLEM_LOCUS2249 [Lemmus lemmus]
MQTARGLLSYTDRSLKKIVKLYKFGSQTFCGMVGQGAEHLIPARFKKKTKAGEMAQLVKHVPPNHRDEHCSPGFHGGCEVTVIPAAETGDRNQNVLAKH